MSRAVALALVFVASLAVGPVVAPIAAQSPTDAGAPARTATAGAGATAQTTTPDAGTAARASTADTPTIEKSIRLHLTPGEPGEIDVTVTYDVPEELTSLRVQLPADATDLRGDGFSREDGVVQWDGETDPARIRFSVPANRSTSSGRVESVSAAGAQEGYTFVDAGDWALVTVPGLGTEWSWRNAEDVTLTEDVSVAGEGSTGGKVAYLGPVETHSRTANGQTFTLVVPEAASLAASPDDILSGLAGLSERLRVGERDSGVWMVAAPTSVRWSAQGIEYGGNDFWVVADADLDTPGNVWFHEYVHTRQGFTTTTSGRWAMEAMADYYAALASLEQGYIGFSSFSNYLGRGDDPPWADDVLANPQTWSVGTNYVKGSLVWGELDRRLRVESESSHTMADVFWRLNRLDGPVSNDDIVRAVAEESSADVAGVAERYTESQAGPRMWNRFEHSRAYSTQPARMEYDVREYRVTGPFRNETFAEPPELYVGETLAVAGNVTNTGGANGEYAATLALDGDVVAAAEGTLRPTETAAVSLTHEFAATGTYNLTVGRNTVPVTVERPAEPTVSDVSVSPGEVAPGDQVAVTATLSSPEDAPATGSVAVTLDGEQVASVNATLAPGESVTRTVNVTVEERGEHTVAVGDRTVRVTAGEGTDGGGTDGGGGADGGADGGVPGFGVAVALAAVLVAALLASRGR